MARKPQPLKPVLVHWLDSQAQPGWRPYDRNADLSCTTVGHLVEQTENRVVVALNNSSGGYGDYMTIPRCAVKLLQHLTPAPEKAAEAAGDDLRV